jgi:hypothetical protein
MRRRPGRVRRFVHAVRRRIPWLRGGDERPPDPWRPEDDALVPKGPPRRRPPSVSAALEPPTDDDPLVYPTETEAVATALLEEEQPAAQPSPRRRFPWRRAA